VVRRATAAFLGTVAGTSLLVGAKVATATPEATSRTAVGSPIGDPAGGDGAGTGGSPAAPPTSGPASRVAAKASATRPAGATSTRPATPRTTAPSPTRATTTCKTATGSAAGVSSPGISSVTVTVKVCNGTISSSSGYMPDSNWEKNSSAIPALNSLAVTYGKTNISKVYYSGCSLTSAAYRNSLSSALSKVG
jgi:hypothetical protein